jgi:hypothetical protein
MLEKDSKKSDCKTISIVSQDQKLKHPPIDKLTNITKITKI